MPSPCGAIRKRMRETIRRMVDEESICKTSLSEEKITKEQPVGVLTIDKVGKVDITSERFDFIYSPHPPLSRSPFSAGEGQNGEAAFLQTD